MKKLMTFVIATLPAITSLYSQIPNGDFESWTDMGSYNNPDQWSCLNDLTTAMGSYTCLKGTPGYEGASYIKLVTQVVGGMGVIPGIAVCGEMDLYGYTALSGFPFNQRPEVLTGTWQHMIYGTSQGYIDVQLTRWDTDLGARVTVASAHKTLTGMAMSWANFNITLDYYDGYNPDTCIITMSASGDTPTENDYLYVDGLEFTGEVTGIHEDAAPFEISLYPNPTTDEIHIDLSAFNSDPISVEVFDLTGRTVFQSFQISSPVNYALDVTSLVPGTYILHVVSGEAVVPIQFVRL